MSLFVLNSAKTIKLTDALKKSETQNFDRYIYKVQANESLHLK